MCCAVAFHWLVVDLQSHFLSDHAGDQLGRGFLEVDHAAGAVLLKPVADMEVLLEVMAQRNVEERPASGCQLHAGRQAALHNRQIAGGKVPVEVVDVAAHFEAFMPRQRVRVDPGAADNDHPERRDLLFGFRKRVDHASQQVAADAGAADGDDADLLVVSVTQSCRSRARSAKSEGLKPVT